MNKITAREQSLDLLLAILKKGSYSPIVLNEALSKNTFSTHDRGLITTLVYGVLQRKMTLDYVLSLYVAKERKLDTWVRVLLWLSIYQKMYLDRIPDHALVNEAVEIAKKRGHRGISNLVNGVLRRLIREGLPDFNAIQPEERRDAIQNSHPEWLLRLWREEWDLETARRIAEADNQPPLVSVRVNRTRLDPDTLIDKLHEVGIDAKSSTLSPDGLVLASSGSIAASPFFVSGQLTIQDQSSMLVADAVAPEASMLVLDACAGPGGKTTHLAERMDGKGRIIALDLHPHKTKLIDEAAKRLGLDSCIETRALDARRAADQFASQSFDRVLLDVPCSGFGVIRRKPEIRWEKNPEDIAQLVKVQKEILERTAPLVRPGGLLIYSTCTISRAENDWQISQFLAEHPEFEPDSDFAQHLPASVRERVHPLEGWLQLMPFDFNTDGFFIACLRRSETGQ
ncbi:16S rRNA (cytosine(967)-C(5))-methyltransferase RsmB [Sporolactobacillus spathodeae]|uniref:16S rRNA (cytosine(967)-C(5))-methyltransferase n=1 Tax=Sporolactobacillus spathodeae TaxID=1465502 RepID=A0ABS2Q8Y7_9BACL|nr:16S rRNA (cytosine(967)-C(5))-methyltransferase RsmB [Sporolactobacillus spathodeae]MBM7658253.1 16S rRNA (cytosine967-C5)-methyltransferase [Sporolactobacillus spathodeae]